MVMEAALLLPVFVFMFVPINAGTTGTQQSNCGSWIAYTDEKCLHIADTTLLQTKQEAEQICAMFAETHALDDVPRLVTVRSDTEEKALKQFLFEEMDILENVWLGVDTGDDGVLRWNNGSELYFNNLAAQNITGTNRQCVQMESGQGIYPMGKWVQVNCRKRNIVVCEKIQVWLAAKLQDTFLTFKLKVERQIEILGNEVQTKEKTEIPEKTAGKDVSLKKASSRCGDWKEYKDQKCFKIATHAGHQTKEDAETICQALSDGLHQESHPRLVIIKTQEDQAFLEHFLFTESKVVDKVWLGLNRKGNRSEFQWDEGTSVLYSNWANQSSADDRHQCVQMASGEELYATGLWVRVNCQKSGLVVCERQQTWSLEILQNMVLNNKLEQEMKFNEEIASLKQKNEALEKGLASVEKKNQASEIEINNLKANPVPIGFIYVQLPAHDPPTTLWPQTSWKDVRSEYAGLFFRVEGGDAAPFGQLQEDNTRKLADVYYSSNIHDWTDPDIPEDGSWSKYVPSGRSGPGPMYGLRFRLTTGEVRPRNKSVKIWQRIK